MTLRQRIASAGQILLDEYLGPFCDDVKLRLGPQPVGIVFGDDQLDGEPIECYCNTWRYEQGHMQSCPLVGYPPEVVVIDRVAPEASA